MSRFKSLVRPLLVGITVLAFLALGVATSQATHGPGVPYVVGDVFAAVGNSEVEQFTPTGTSKHVLNDQSGAQFTTGMCFDADDNLFVTNFDAGTVSKFDNQGNLLVSAFASGLSLPESCVVMANGDILVSEASGGLRRFSPAGAELASYPVSGRTDFIDLAADQCTVYYTQEGQSVLRFDICANTQLANFADGLTGRCFALRIRENGEVLVACESHVHRLSSTGAVIQSYPASTCPGTSLLFALNLDPDGQTFWTADLNNGQICRINIDTGALVTQFNGTPNTQLAGLAIFGEFTSSQADLSITKSDAPDPVSTGQPLTYTLTVTNAGPLAQATGVTVQDTLPAGVTFGSATASQGSCTQSAGTVTCNLGNLAENGSATVTITVTPQNVGTIINTATVSGDQGDPDDANNTATAQTTVQQGGGQPPPTGTKPGKGCGDKNHVHQRFNECATKPGKPVGGNRP